MDLLIVCRKQKEKCVVECMKMIECGKCGHVVMMCESRNNWPEEKTCAPVPSPVYGNSLWVSFVVSFFHFFSLVFMPHLLLYSFSQTHDKQPLVYPRCICK